MNYAIIEQYLSKARLVEYKIKLNTNDNSTVLEHYIYNINLSKVFYYLLQNLEIVLRNAINNELLKIQAKWLFDSNFLEENEIKKIKKAKEVIRKPTVLHDDIIANLDFGFYARLFDSKYEKSIWHKILKKVFPNIERHNAKRSYISKRIHKFKALRNRIAHHEPIYYWDNLDQYHNEIIEFIGWINKDMQKFTIEYDEFNKIDKPNKGQ